MESFSVLLSVYNKERPEYLERALNSVYFEQTLKPNQIVLVKDGQLDDDLDRVIEAFSAVVKCEFTVVEIIENVGLAAALNIGLNACNYELVARMDTDDLSLPDRFLLQVRFMTENNDISVLSGQLSERDKYLNKELNVREVPINHFDILKTSKFRNPMSHPAVIFRKSEVLSVGGYPLYKNSQDWALWSLMLTRGFKMSNLDKVILHMRTDDELFLRRGFKYFVNEVKLLRYFLSIGHINFYEFFVNSLSRLVLRSSPIFFKHFMYKHFR